MTQPESYDDQRPDRAVTGPTFLLAGFVVAVVGTVIYLAGDGSDGATFASTAVLAVASVLLTVGAIGWGVRIGLEDATRRRRR